MNVFIYEMKQYKKSIIMWSVSLAVLTVLFMSATGIFVDESNDMKNVLLSFPEALRSAMSIDVELFFSGVGFYSYIFVYLGLAAAIQAANLGLGIISKENRMKTADFLLSKPKSRTAIYVQKLLAAACSLLITQAVFYTAATVSMAYVTDGDFAVKPFVLISLTFSMLQIMFLAIGLFIAVVLQRVKSTTSITMGISFGLFMLGMISAIANSETLRYLSPFKYFDNSYIMNNGAYETEFVLIGAAVTLILMVASYFIYVKKDVKAAI